MLALCRFDCLSNGVKKAKQRIAKNALFLLFWQGHVQRSRIPNDVFAVRYFLFLKFLFTCFFFLCVGGYDHGTCMSEKEPEQDSR